MAKAKPKSKSKPKVTKKKQPQKDSTKSKKKATNPVKKTTVPKKNSKNKKTKTDKITNDLKKDNKSKKKEKTTKKSKKSSGKKAKDQKSQTVTKDGVNDQAIKDKSEFIKRTEPDNELDNLPFIMECTESDDESSQMLNQDDSIPQEFLTLPQVDKDLIQDDLIDVDFVKDFDHSNEDFPIDLDLSGDLIDEELTLNLDCFVNLQQLVLSNDSSNDYVQSICDSDFTGIETSIDNTISLDSGLSNNSDSKITAIDIDNNPVKTLQSEEVINCTCGFREEDGLMIQCDICLTWQHALCCGVNNDSEVPENYLCAYCTQPLNARPSQRYSYANHFLTLSKLPRFNQRTCDEDLFRRRERIMTKTFELSAELRKIHKLERTLTAKLSIAEEPDHPKLYMWSANWDQPDPSTDYDPELLVGPIGERPIESVDCRLRLLDKIDEDQQDMSYRLSAILNQLKQLESDDYQREVEEKNLKRVLKMIEKDLKTIATAVSIS